MADTMRVIHIERIASDLRFFSRCFLFGWITIGKTISIRKPIHIKTVSTTGMSHRKIKEKPAIRPRIMPERH